MTPSHCRYASSRPAAVAGRLARRTLSVVAAAALLPLAAVQLRPSSAPAVEPPPSAKPAPGGSGSRALGFELNAGQDHPAVRFSTRAAGAHVSFTATEVVVALTGPGGAADSGTTSAAPPAEVSVLRTSFVGANPSPDVAPGAPRAGRVNYLRGADPKGWVTDVPTYRGVGYPSLYPGIDLTYDGPQGQLKSTYTVAPGADPSDIRWRYEGARSVTLDPSGDLRVTLSGGERGGAATVVTEKAPVVWQDINGRRRMVPARYDIGTDDSVGFTLGDYDRSEVLVIDPTLAYVKVLGGPMLDDYATGIAVDEKGNSYVTGTTSSPSGIFPITPSAFRSRPGGLNEPEAFVTKFDPDGEIIFSTYLGGTGSDDRRLPQPPRDQKEAEQLLHELQKQRLDEGPKLDGTFEFSSPTYTMSIAVDDAGSAYVSGSSQSADFPTTPGALQPKKCDDPGKSAEDRITCAATRDAFVTKLNDDGSELVYSTYLGGFDTDIAEGIAVDAFGQAYVTGSTLSDDFPLKSGYQRSRKSGSDGFLTKPNSDAFLTKLNREGSQLVYSTYLGGGDEDGGADIAVDQSGAAYVTGFTKSTGFPTTDRAFRRNKAITGGGNNFSTDVFVTKMEPDGSAPAYSTYLGGRYGDLGRGIAVNTAGQAYVTGWTGSHDFRTFPECESRGLTPDDCSTNAMFVTKLNAAGSAPVYSTSFGTHGLQGPISAEDIAIDAEGYAYVGGYLGDGVNSVPYVATLTREGVLSSETCTKDQSEKHGGCVKPHDPAEELFWQYSDDKFAAIATDHPAAIAAAAGTPRKAYAAGSIFSPMPSPQHCRESRPEEAAFDEAEALPDQLREDLEADRDKYLRCIGFPFGWGAGNLEHTLNRDVLVAKYDYDVSELPRRQQSHPVPTVVSASPASLARGATRRDVTITGTNFIEGATAAFSGSGITVHSTRFDNAKTLTASVSVEFDSDVLTGSRAVAVTNPSGTAGVCRPDCFSVTATAGAGPPVGPTPKPPTTGSTTTTAPATTASDRSGSTRTDDGYWLAASDGGIFAFGNARFHGSTGAIKLNQPIAGMAPTPSGNGYWLAASDGGIFAFGDAVFRGSTGAIKLNKPIVGIAPTPSGKGYWLVGSDGGIFAFGDAVFRGSTGAIKLNKPIAGMAPTPSGKGYWLVASDGGIFAFGDAGFHGSTGAMKLAKPVVGMAPSSSGKGYRLVASDGGIFAFGDAVFHGSTGAMKLNQPIVGMAGG